MEVFLRKLVEEDALVSYKWRNDADVWQWTGRRPDRIITPEIELDWIRKILQNPNEARYAICVLPTGEYIGNVQLTNIENGKAEFHIFIGEKKYWGTGVGKKATLEMIRIGFEQLGLEEIYLLVHKKNSPAIVVYLKTGFVIDGLEGDFLKMIITRNQWKRCR